MEFASSADVLHVVQDHALEARKSVHVESQGGDHKLIKCSCAACGFFVRVYKRKDKSIAPTTNLPQNVSSCDCTARPKPTQRQIAVVRIVQSAVLADRGVAAKAAIKQVQGMKL